ADVVDVVTQRARLERVLVELEPEIPERVRRVVRVCQREPPIDRSAGRVEPYGDVVVGTILPIMLARRARGGAVFGRCGQREGGRHGPRGYQGPTTITRWFRPRTF